MTVRAEAVEWFLRQLNAEGWRIGTDQFIAANNVLLALTVRPELLLPGQTVADWIAPIVCRSRADQQMFRDRFTAIEQSADEGDEFPFNTPLPMTAARKNRRVLAFVAVYAVLFAAIMIWAFYDATPATGGGGAPSPVLNQENPITAWRMIDIRYLGALGGAGLLAGAFLALRTRRRQHDLSKAFARDKDVEHHFPRIGTSVFIPSDFRRVTQRLRLRRNIETTNLNVARSVEITVRQAGFFTPVYATRGVTPEYIALIDRSSMDDQQAILYRDVLDRVRGDDVFVDVYEFHGDPRICWREGRQDDRCTLDDLVARHSDRALLLFADGEQFLHPLTREPYRWTKSLASSFRSTALFTSRPVDEWDDVEWRLARTGMLVLPSTTAGFAALVDAIERPRGDIPAEGPDGGGRSILSDEDLWTSNTAPEKKLIASLFGELESRLGEDGMTWLAACAVYPALHWYLTLFLGTKLHITEMEQKLVALVRLPWFRRGVLPDWLRAELILTLPRPTEREIRTHLEELFRLAVRERRGESEIHLVTFRDLKNASPDDSPLREYVLVRFMSGRSPKPLTVRVAEMFEGIRGAIGGGRTRRDPAWRVILSYVPFLGFFATTGKSASQELRWHAWNALAIVFACASSALVLTDVNTVVVLAAAAVAALLFAMRSALRGGRLRAPIFSGLADHLAAAEQGAPLSRAWRAMILIGSYSNPVTALPLMGIRIRDLRWHARNGFLVSALIIGTAYLIVSRSSDWMSRSSDAETVVPTTLWVLGAVTAAALFQGMRMKRLPLWFLSRFAGSFPTDLVRDSSHVVPLSAIVGLIVIVFQCTALGALFAGRGPFPVPTALGAITLEAVIVLALAVLSDRLQNPRLVLTVGLALTICAMVAALAGSSTMAAFSVVSGASLVVPNVIVIMANVARNRQRSVAVLLSLTFVTGLLTFPVSVALATELDRREILMVLTAVSGLVLVPIVRRWTRSPSASPQIALEPRRNATSGVFAEWGWTFLANVVLMPIIALSAHMVEREFRSDVMLFDAIVLAPLAVLTHLANGTQSDVHKRLKTTWATMAFLLFLATFAFQLNRSPYSTFSRNEDGFYLFIGSLVALVTLIPATWLSAVTRPPRWQATNIAVSNVLFIASLAARKELLIFVNRRPILLSAVVIALALIYLWREAIATRLATLTALTRRWLFDRRLAEAASAGN